MSTTPTTTPPRQTSPSATYTHSPSTSPPSSIFISTPTSVDVTYRIIGIKPTNTDWRKPNPSDLIQIVGPVSGVKTPISNDDDDAAAEEEEDDDGTKIPCKAHLTWGQKSIHLTCLYHPPLFTDFGGCEDETVNAAHEAECLRSVSVTMQSAICSGDGEVAEDEDVRDDDGNLFLVLHVNEGFDGSARLYCKKVREGQNGLTDAVGESLALGTSDEKMDEEEDNVGR